MKVESDGGTTVEIDPDELDAVSDTVDGVATLAATLLGDGADSATDSSPADDATVGECGQCGALDVRLRPLVAAMDDGTPTEVPVCRDCQAQFVADQLAARSGEDDAPTR